MPNSKFQIPNSVSYLFVIVFCTIFWSLFFVQTPYADAVARQSWDIPPGPMFDRTTMVKVGCVYYQKDIEAIIGLNDFGPLAMNGKELACYEPFNLYDAIAMDLRPGTAVTLCLSDGQVSGLDCMAAGDDSLVTTVFEGKAGVDPMVIQRRQQEQGLQMQILELSRSASAFSSSQVESYLESIRTIADRQKLSLSSATEQKLVAVERVKDMKKRAVVPSARGRATFNALGRGSRGDDVRQLQEFLARDPALYPESLVTGYFGPLTETAVKRFQAREGIVNSGDPATTGFGVVGPRTRGRLHTLFH